MRGENPTYKVGQNMKNDRVFKEGEFLISNYIPEICILNGYDKTVEILKIHTSRILNKEKFLVTDIKILEDNKIEENVFIPLARKVFVNNNELIFLGKQLTINNLNKIEKELFLKMLKYSLKHYPKEEYFTISNLDTIAQEHLISLSKKSIEYATKTNDLSHYLPLITLGYNEETNQIVYTIPLLQYLDILVPSIKAKIINKNFNELKKIMETNIRKSFEKAKEKEFSL